MNNRQRMYKTNSLIKKALTARGFKDIYLFPHLRFSKDYSFDGCGFDAFAFFGRKIWFMQFKTNVKAPQKEIERYKNIETNKDCRCAWIYVKKGKVYWHTTRINNQKMKGGIKTKNGL